MPGALELGGWPDASQLGEWLGVSFDAALPRADQACRSARGIIESYTRQPLLSSQTVEVVDVEPLPGWWSSARTVVLERWPVTAVASVAAAGVALAAGSWSFRKAGILTFDSTTKGPLTVTYTAGWAPLPEDVRTIALRLAAAHEHNPADTNHYAGAVTGHEGVTDPFGPLALTDGEENTLARYSANAGIA